MCIVYVPCVRVCACAQAGHYMCVSTLRAHVHCVCGADGESEEHCVGGHLLWDPIGCGAGEQGGGPLRLEGGWGSDCRLRHRCTVEIGQGRRSHVFSSYAQSVDVAVVAVAVGCLGSSCRDVFVTEPALHARPAHLSLADLESQAQSEPGAELGHPLSVHCRLLSFAAPVTDPSALGTRGGPVTSVPVAWSQAAPGKRGRESDLRYRTQSHLNTQVSYSLRRVLNVSKLAENLPRTTPG